MTINGFGNNNNWNNYKKNYKVNINNNANAYNKTNANSKLNVNNLNSVKSDGFIKSSGNDTQTIVKAGTAGDASSLVTSIAIGWKTGGFLGALAGVATFIHGKVVDVCIDEVVNDAAGIADRKTGNPALGGYYGRPRM